MIRLKGTSDSDQRICLDRCLSDTQNAVRTHRAVLFNWEATRDELTERHSHGKVVLLLQPGVSERDGYPLKRRILEHDAVAWAGKWQMDRLEVQNAVHPRKNTCRVCSSIRAKWRPPMSVARMITTEVSSRKSQQLSCEKT